MVGESLRFVAVENKRKELSEAVRKKKGGNLPGKNLLDCGVENFDFILGKENIWAGRVLAKS